MTALPPVESDVLVEVLMGGLMEVLIGTLMGVLMGALMGVLVGMLMGMLVEVLLVGSLVGILVGVLVGVLVEVLEVELEVELLEPGTQHWISPPMHGHSEFPYSLNWNDPPGHPPSFTLRQYPLPAGTLHTSSTQHCDW